MYDIRNDGRSPGRTPSFHLSKQHEYQLIAKSVHSVASSTAAIAMELDRLDIKKARMILAVVLPIAPSPPSSLSPSPASSLVTKSQEV